jgi:hypothetical protein
MALAALVSMVAAPALAQPRNPAAKLSLTDSGSSNGPVRAGAPTKRSSKVAAPLIILGVAMVGGIAAAVATSSGSSMSNGTPTPTPASM